MLRRPLLALMLGMSALLLAGCDAMRVSAFRFEVGDAASGEPVPGALVSVFWFDAPEDALGKGPLESRVREVGEARGHESGYGLGQADWIEERTDPTGRARVLVPHFYAGALLLPLHDLLWGAREADPTGLWIRAKRPDDPPGRFRDFVVAEGEDGVRTFRVREGAGGPGLGEPAGTIERVRVEGEPEFCWRVVVPVER